jgi:hypothetical protein
VPYILSRLPSRIQDVALLLLVFAFFSRGRRGEQNIRIIPNECG